MSTDRHGYLDCSWSMQYNSPNSSDVHSYNVGLWGSCSPTYSICTTAMYPHLLCMLTE